MDARLLPSTTLGASAIKATVHYPLSLSLPLSSRGVAQKRGSERESEKKEEEKLCRHPLGCLLCGLSTPATHDSHSRATFPHYFNTLYYYYYYCSFILGMWRALLLTLVDATGCVPQRGPIHRTHCHRLYKLRLTIAARIIFLC